LDSSGESLHKRGYKVAQHKAPISEVLAAGLLKMANWDGKTNLLDPMCGSGTLLIEAAMMAANIPPQVHRKKFGFENWQNFDAELFTQIKEARLNKIKEFSGKLIGFDINKKVAEDAQNNVDAANMGDFISIINQDFFLSKKEISPLKIIFNPPYDQRLAVNNDQLYQNIGNCLKQNYPNTDTWFITSDIDAHKKIGLRPSRKIRLFNGKLECKLYKFELYEGSKKQPVDA
jgi:putative N6-adenine-specific DNA methylase